MILFSKEDSDPETYYYLGTEARLVRARSFPRKIPSPKSHVRFLNE